ncbi:MBL fold metallo-hydrolase [Adhaeribacter radiodurans]|uniref:MBL fold metallo-hydrolase n=1 Tax=Adhaeribacter radiodurans TaxID=2745197 RepID=A0A7L7L6H7_9BACT|nr:MBL fold metallo-hydrolase [Adhaeribacter radiodurans]QMU28441.1 MBL fold metallo-hydrolase [Adhaeribacter radiodurans]
MPVNYICTTCGVQYAATDKEPERCIICEDDRQYVNWQGQTWTTLPEMQQEYRNDIQQVEPNLYQIHTTPKFGIAQKAYLLVNPSGNILWDCITLIDEDTIKFIQSLGGIQAIALSHPHYYSSIVNWSRTFNNAPIYIHASDKEWVTQSDNAIQFWEGKILELIDSISIINCGGHFPGACVLHWPAGADGKGVVLSGDTLQVAMDRQSVSFMYSYPNLIPLRQAEIIAIRDALQGVNFERMYGAFEPYIKQNARQAFDHSIVRYLQIYE